MLRVDTSVWSLALLAALCVRRRLELLTTDQDFLHAARHIDPSVWAPVRR